MKTTCSFSCLTVLMLVGQPLEASVIEAWVQRYSVVVSNSNDTMVRVVTDQAGDVVVAGYTEDGTGSEMLTIKYSGSDGAVLWLARHDNPQQGNDAVRAVTVDGSGDVLVTGSITVKYAGADGTVLWEKLNAGVYPSAIAVDGHGDVVVTGSSLGGATAGQDYYTAKYAAADGALLWERRYNGPANQGDLVRDVAIGPNGVTAIAGASALTVEPSTTRRWFTGRICLRSPSSALLPGFVFALRRLRNAPTTWNAPARLMARGAPSPPLRHRVAGSSSI